MLQDKPPKKLIDEVAMSAEEVWYAIRYLDPDVDSRRADRFGIIAAFLIVLLLCAIGLSLHFRGL
jgi:hypothetical protein